MSEPSESDSIELENIRSVFQNGADDEIWKPGTTISESVKKLKDENNKLKKSFMQSDESRKEWLKEFDRLKLSNVRMKEALLDVNTMFASRRNPDTLSEEDLETWRSVQEVLEITERKKK